MSKQRIVGRREQARRRRRVKRLCILLALVLFAGVGFALGIMLWNRTEDQPVDEVVESTESSTQGDEAEAPYDEDDDEEEPPGDESDQDDSGEDEADPEEDYELPDAVEDEQTLAQEILAEMTLWEKVLQMFIITPEQLTGVGTVTQAGETTRAALEEYPVGGLIYFSSNLKTADQVRTMLAAVQEMSEIPLFLAVDEEGGSVSRMAKNSNMGMTTFPAMGTLETTDQAYTVGLTIGSELLEYGFNVDFAPVADVNSNPNNTVIGTRAFSSDALTAAEMVAAAVTGFSESGILCTLKHFPGHGDTSTDSHYGAAVSEKTLEELEECEFLPFISGIEAGAQLVMVGHISVPAVTGDDTPASLSYAITTELLRDQLGFEGLIITDSMQMGAITQQYSAGEAAVAAIQAGVDIILMPENLTKAVNGIMTAIENGELTEARIDESVLRILQTKIDAGIISTE